MSQIQRLPDPSNLRATIQPIDTYFRPTEQQVAGAPVGPNPARQIAQALGQFNEATQKFYFEPAHEQMIQQQQADAQVYHSRLENFKAFDEAVASGAIHQGDNPWLQAFTKEMYAKDAANELAVRSAEFTDRQDILSGEYGETGDAQASFNLAFQEAQQAALEAHGDDPYLRQAFMQMSGPVRDRAANQFAQGLRRHNVVQAQAALEKDILNQLDQSFEGFAAADSETKGRMIQDFALASKALSVESNLLDKRQVNATIGRAILSQVQQVAAEDKRTALNLLDLLDDLETAPGSKLRDTTAFREEVERVRQRIEDGLEQDESDSITVERNARTRAGWSFSQESTLYLRDIDDYAAALKDPEVIAKARELEEKYAGLVDNPYDSFMRVLRQRAQVSISETSQETSEQMRQVYGQYKRGEVTAKGLRQWADDNNENLSDGDFFRLHSAADADTAVLEQNTLQDWHFAAGVREQDLLQEFGDEDIETGGYIRGARYNSKKSELDREIKIQLSELEASAEFKGLDARSKADAVKEVVDGVYETAFSVDAAAPSGPPVTSVSLQERRVLTGVDPSSRATRSRMEAEMRANSNTDSSKQAELDEKARTARAKEQDIHRKAEQRLEASLGGPRTSTVRVLYAPDVTVTSLPGEKEKIKEDLQIISTTKAQGPEIARQYYSSFRKMAEKHPKYYKTEEIIDPSKILFFDTPAQANLEYDKYLEIKADPSLLEKEVVVTGGHTVKPYQDNIFYMLEQDFGWDLSNEEDPRFQALQKSWASLMNPPESNQNQ